MSNSWNGRYPANDYDMTSRLLTRVVAITASFLAMGCVGPVKLAMRTDYPAAVLHVVGTPPVIDGRARFREIFCRLLAAEPGYEQMDEGCEAFLLRLSDEPANEPQRRALPLVTTRYRVFIVPGFLNECVANLALPFTDAIESLNQGRFRVEEIVVGGRSSSDANATYLAEVIDHLRLAPDETIIFVGHSKGAVDILHCLVNFPQAARRVAAVVSVAGAINGSPLAAAMKTVYRNPTWKLLQAGCDTGDDGALDSLQPSTRLQWITANRLPGSVRYFSIGAFTEREQVNSVLKTGYDLLWPYSPRNDGLLLAADQLIPGGTLLGYANADHWSVALALENLNSLLSQTVQSHRPFPRRVLLEAALLYVSEALSTVQEGS